MHWQHIHASPNLTMNRAFLLSMLAVLLAPQISVSAQTTQSQQTRRDYQSQRGGSGYTSVRSTRIIQRRNPYIQQAPPATPAIPVVPRNPYVQQYGITNLSGTPNTLKTASPQQLPAAVKTSTKEKGYTYRDTLSVDGAKRTFNVHLPPGFRTNRSMPVVFCFHGLRLTGQLMMMISNFNSTADKNGFVVVYPDGIGEAWDDGRSNRGHDDLGFVSAILQKLTTTVGIDRRRVYASGISNGGYFSQLLACAMPDKIAAVGVVGATMMQQAASQCHSNRPMPIMFFLGTSDPLIAWGDGNGRNLGDLGDLVGVSGIGSVDSAIARYGGLLSVPEILNFWTTHNHCPSGTPYSSTEPDRDPSDGTRVKKESYGSSNNEVVLYRIEGGGHTWPGGFPYAPASVAGKISQDIDACDLMWQFFKNKSR